jgi:hypothetical protein
MFFSLCIPTMNRYDQFLKNNLQKYIDNEYINEIIITDEFGTDIDKISLNFNSLKLKLYKNEYRLGCLLNKHKACSLAKNDWIALIDSDNFADLNYFKIASNYILNNNISNNSIISPYRALPNYKFVSGCLNRKNHKEIEKNKLLLNTGNYIINKNLINKINLEKDMENIKYSNACDVMLFNLILFEQLNINFYVVENMEYYHSTHNGSIYLEECNNVKYTELIELIMDRFKNLHKI